MPAANCWLREQRNGCAYLKPTLLHGINATLIVQCGMFFDGLLASALTSAMPYPEDVNTADARLVAEYHDRVHREYTFFKNTKLFKIVTGKTLSELMLNDGRWQSLKVLFDFRNGLAHGRLIEFRVYFDKATDHYEPDFSGNYAVVEKYLLEKKLLNATVKATGRGWPFLESQIADHFCELMQPLAYDIVGFFPDGDAAKYLRSVLENAFTKRPSGGK